MAKRNATPKAAKKPAAAPAQEQWVFHLSNGEPFAALFFSRAEIRKWFKGAKIHGGDVYLA